MTQHLFATPSQLRDYARSHTLTALRTIVDICQNGKKESTKLAAAKEILDRGWGRSVQSITYDTAEGSSLLTILQEAHGNAVAQLSGPQRIEEIPPPEEDIIDEPIPVRRRPRLNDE